MADKSSNALSMLALGLAASGGGGGGGTTNYNQLENKPQINSVELTGNKTLEDLGLDLSDYALIDEAGNKINLEMDEDFKITATLYDKNDVLISTSDEIDLPLESVVVNGSYDSATQSIILTLKNGNTITIPVGSLISGLATQSWVEAKGYATETYVDNAIAEVEDEIPDISGLATKTELAAETTAREASETALTNAINTKQDELTAGTGIIIDSTNNISVDEVDIATVEYVDASISDTMNFIIQERDTEIAAREAGDELLQEAIDLKQDTLTAGTNITIDSNNVISATGGGSSSDIKVFVMPWWGFEDQKSKCEEIQAWMDEHEDETYICVNSGQPATFIYTEVWYAPDDTEDKWGYWETDIQRHESFRYSADEDSEDWYVSESNVAIHFSTSGEVGGEVSLPEEEGSYTLQCTVDSEGNKSFEWVAAPSPASGESF